MHKVSVLERSFDRRRNKSLYKYSFPSSLSAIDRRRFYETRFEEVDRETCALQDVNPEAEDRVNEVAAESQNNEVKVQFADEQGNDDSAAPLTPLDEVEAEDDENRNKRFLNFGFGASGDKSGSGAGSGNFLFDIIRVSFLHSLKILPWVEYFPNDGWKVETSVTLRIL